MDGLKRERESEGVRAWIKTSLPIKVGMCNLILMYACLPAACRENLFLHTPGVNYLIIHYLGEKRKLL